MPRPNRSRTNCSYRCWRRPWGDNRKANDVEEPARALNGFLVLRLSADELVEEFRDENGNLRWQRQA